jgi:hypothetical protein
MNKKNIILTLALFCLALLVRSISLTAVPPSPYWEEVALGYDAYSILKTGADHHGTLLPIIAFESFGDWKPSGYFYAAAFSIALFGLNLFAVRLPSVIAGVAIVMGIGKIAGKLKLNPYWTYLVAAISPWAITFSRSAWEVNLATACITWAMYFLLALFYQQEKKQVSILPVPLIKKVLVAVLLLVAAAYTYHAARIIGPLVYLATLLIWIRGECQKCTIREYLLFFKKKWQLICIPTLVFFFFMSPLLVKMQDPVIAQRFTETAIFSDLSVIEESNRLKELAGNSLIARILYHRFVLFGWQILENYAAHLSGSFLFISGDSNPRHSVQLVGQLYSIEILFLAVGIYVLFRTWKKEYAVLGIWLVSGILPAALTHAVPHALRILPVMPIFLLVIGVGVHTVYSWICEFFNRNKITKKAAAFLGLLVIFGGYGFFVAQFARYYALTYSKQYAAVWQYGYEEMIHQVEQLEKENPQDWVYISRSEGRPAMYYWFYTQTQPTRVQAADSIVTKDQSEFLEFENKFFYRSIPDLITNSIIACTPEEVDQWKSVNSDFRFDTIKTITSLDGTRVWEVLKATKHEKTD